MTNEIPPPTDDQEILIIEPWPLLRQVSNDECWESISENDLKILGVKDRKEWEERFTGNPCDDPRLK